MAARQKSYTAGGAVRRSDVTNNISSVQTNSVQTNVTGVTAKSQSLVAGGVAFLIGAMLIFAVGFSQTTAAHDAAHDTRHSLAFPCH